MNKHFYLVLFVGLIGLATLWWAYQPSPRSTLEDGKKAESPELLLRNLTLHEINATSHNGWVVETPQGIGQQTLNLIECHQITCTLVTDNKPVAQVSAAKSVINRADKHIFLQGQVEGVFNEFKLNGHNMEYLFESHQLLSNEPAHYSHPFFSITAEQSAIDLKSKKVVLKQVTSEFSNSPGNHYRSD